MPARRPAVEQVVTPPRGLLVTLSLTVSVAYGALFYGFSVLLSDAAAGGEFTSTVLSAAFGGAVVTGGISSVVVGRVADHRGARSIIGLGAVTGGIGLALFSVATGPVQVLLVWWLVLGPTMAMTFYEPTYVVIDQWFPGPARVRAIATLTLLAGLSGPVSIPVTGALVEALGWRATAALLGLVLALTCGAAAVFVIPPGTGGRPALAREAVPVPARAMLADRRLVLFTVAAVLGYGAMEATVVHRVARFEEGGAELSTVTAWAAAAGLLSLPARFLLPSLANRFRPTWVLTGVLATLTVAIGLAVGGSPGAALAVHFGLFGLVFGAALPLRAVVMGDWFSGAAYGRLMGVQAAAIALGRSGGPALVGALRDATSSYRLPMGVLTVAMGSAALLTLVAGRAPTMPVAHPAAMSPTP